MKITFIGSGYVGLVSGVMMSHLGHFVTCLDQDKEKIAKLKKLQPPVFEENLQEYITRYGNTERLQFSSDYPEAVKGADAIFIAVNTPGREDGSANLDYMFSAISSAARYASHDCLFVIKSTVPPGTCSKLLEYLRGLGFNQQIVSNPEFLREGSAIQDFLNPDRIVIGYESEAALSLMRQLYKPITDQGYKLLATDLITAELIKYASNSFLACKIAFINELADLCEAIKANVGDLSYGIGLDKRIGSEFLKAGPGFGGSCFPKDIMALKHLTDEKQSDFLILDAVIKTNTRRPGLIVKKIEAFIGGNIMGKKLAFMGLTYKAGTDDIRSSPALILIDMLLEKGAKVSAYDPQGNKNAKEYFQGRAICADSALEASKNADAIIIATEWPEFQILDYQEIRKHLKQPVLIDLRNILDKQALVDLGYKCYFLGQSQS